MVRVRPFLSTEMTQYGKKGKIQCSQTYGPQDTQNISLIRPGVDRRDYLFDNVLDMAADQSYAYEQLAQPVVEDVLSGFNGVIMAFG